MDSTTIASHHIKSSLAFKKDFQLAQMMLRKDHFLDALDRLKTLLKENPSWYPDILIQLFKRLTSQYENPHLRFVISELALMVQDYETAFYETKEAIELDPTYSQNYYVLGKLFRSNVYQNEIQALFEKAFLSKIFDQSIIDLLSKIYIDSQDYKKNILFHETLIEEYPENIPYYLNLGELYQQAHLYESAANTFNKISELNPSMSSECANKVEGLIKYHTHSQKIRETLIELYLKSCEPEKVIPHISHLLKYDKSYIEKAIAYYKKTSDLFPGTDNIELELIQTLIKAEDYTEAITKISPFIKAGSHHEVCLSLLSNILEHQPKHISALESYAEIQLIMKQTNEAISAYKTIIHELSENFEHYIDVLDQLYTQYPQEEFLHFRGELFLKNNQPDKAYELASQLSPKPGFLSFKSRCEIALKKWGSVKDTFKEALKLNLYSKEVHDACEHAYQAWLNNLMSKGSTPNKEDAFIYYFSGETEKALESFQQLSDQSADTGHLQFYIGKAFFDLGRYEVALTQLTQLTKFQQDLDKNIVLMANYYIGIIHLLSGNIAEGVKAFHEILAIDYKYPFVKQLLETYQNFGVFDFRGKVLNLYQATPDGPLKCAVVPNIEGQQFLHKGTQLQNISFAYQHNNKAVEFLLRQQPKAAEEELLLAIQLEPTLTAAYNNLAIIYILQNDYEQAEAHLQKAKEVNAKLETIYLNESIIHLKNNDFEKAEGCLKEAQTHNPDNPFIWLNQGDLAYIAQNRLTDSFTNWDKAYTFGILTPILNQRTQYLSWTSGPNEQTTETEFQKPSQRLSKYAQVTIDDLITESPTPAQEKEVPETDTSKEVQKENTRSAPKVSLPADNPFSALPLFSDHPQ